ncbi:MAG: hypothetical protein JXR63_05655 [Spirochaetales bacterium]|nr:hypothetical protein [Spirochaetales bacterium]
MGIIIILNNMKLEFLYDQALNLKGRRYKLGERNVYSAAFTRDSGGIIVDMDISEISSSFFFAIFAPSSEKYFYLFFNPRSSACPA